MAESGQIEPPRNGLLRATLLTPITSDSLITVPARACKNISRVEHELPAAVDNSDPVVPED